MSIIQTVKDLDDWLLEYYTKKSYRWEEEVGDVRRIERLRMGTGLSAFLIGVGAEQFLGDIEVIRSFWKIATLALVAAPAANEMKYPRIDLVEDEHKTINYDREVLRNVTKFARLPTYAIGSYGILKGIAFMAYGAYALDYNMGQEGLATIVKGVGVVAVAGVMYMVGRDPKMKKRAPMLSRALNKLKLITAPVAGKLAKHRNRAYHSASSQHSELEHSRYDLCRQPL